MFPEGINGQWNDGREFRRSGVDDVGFLKRLAGELASRGIADPTRLYIAGISNGGMMTFRVLCEASELFAGAGTIIASMPVGAGENCRLKKPVPVVMFNGTADPLVPYEGGEVGFRGERGSVWAVERTAAFLARSNGCGEHSELLLSSGSRADAVKVMKLDWSACTSGQTITLYRLEGGGHQVFGRGRSAFPAILGPGTNQISAPKTIMGAFAAQKMTPQ